MAQHLTRLKFPFLIRLLLAAGTIAASQPAFCQGGLDGIMADAQKQFAEGKFSEALDGFKRILEIAQEQIAKDPKLKAQLEPVYFMIGAAYFNAQQYQQASEALLTHLKEFPQSTRVAESKLYIAQSNFYMKELDKAKAMFEAVEKDAKSPDIKNDALLFLAFVANEQKKESEALAPLERLVGKDINDFVPARGALNLALMQAKLKQPDKAVATLTLLSRRLKYLANVGDFNSACIQVGDMLLAQPDKAEDALACYRLMKGKEELIALQERQVSILEKLATAREAAAQKAASPDGKVRLMNLAGKLRSYAEEGKKILPELQKRADPMPAILLRTGKAFYDLGQKWASIVAYDELVKRYPNADEKEAAIFALAAVYPEVNQGAVGAKWADTYLKEFPKGKFVNDVTFTKAVVAIQGDDPEAGIKILKDMLAAQKDPKEREKVSLVVSNALFSIAKYDDALAGYEAYLKEFPKTEMSEEVAYRKILCLVFAGKYKDALDQLNKYIEKYPDGPYTPDAVYRRMVCLFAASQYEDVVKRTENFEKNYPGHNMMGEVLALRGDAYSQMEGKEEEAGDAYLKGFKNAKNDDSLNYNLFEAIKIWQKSGHWDKINDTLQDFVKEQPDHPSASTAWYWISRAMVKLQKGDEAKATLSRQIKKDMENPRKDGVEMMIQLLAEQVARKKRPAAPQPVLGTDGQPLPNQPPPPPAAPEKRPDDEIGELIGGPQTDTSRTANARLFLAKALAMGSSRVENAARMRDTYLDQLAEFDTKDLSANILGRVAEHLFTKALRARENGEAEVEKASMEKAEKFCKEILASYPKSAFLEYAYIGMGEISYQRQNWKAAYQWFRETIDVAGGEAKMKEAILGQAKCLVELGEFDSKKNAAGEDEPGAIKLFQQAAQTKEWGRDAAAQAMYFLGEIEMRRKKPAEAISFFERTYTAYKRYKEWAIRAYLRAADAYVEKGDKASAKSTLQDAQRQEALVGHALLKEVQKKLNTL